MKLTREQLKRIIKEELNEVTLYDPQSGEPWKMGAKHTSDFVKQQLGKPPWAPLEERVDRIEAKLDELIRSLGGTTAATKVELEE